MSRRIWRVLGGCLVAVALLSVIACGDDTAVSQLVDLTVVNATAEDVRVSIDGSESSIPAGREDTITLSGSDRYSVVVTGSSTGRTLYTETLTPDEIEDMGGRIVVMGRD